MRTDTLKDKQIIQKLHDFNQNHGQGFNFCIVTRTKTEGVLKVHERTHQPCYGELRTHYKDEKRPGDLYNPFPKGTPVGISATFYRNNTGLQPFLSWISSNSESPWKSSFGKSGLDYTTNKNGLIGFVLRDTKIDPTVLLNMLVNAKIEGTELWNKLVDKGVPADIAFVILGHAAVYYGGSDTCLDRDYTKYSFRAVTDMQRFHQGKPIKLGDKTFYEREAYKRKLNSEIWAGPNAVSLVKHLRSKGMPSKYSISDVVKYVVPEVQELMNE